MAESAATKFFYKHAGYSYPSGASTREQTAARWQSARALARAEQEAERRGWTYDWEHDQDADTSWMDEEQLEEYERGVLEVLSVVLRDENGRPLASLGGVSVYARGPRDPEIRVVEAELAYAALPEIKNNPTWSRVFR